MFMYVSVGRWFKKCHGNKIISYNVVVVCPTMPLMARLDVMLIPSREAKSHTFDMKTPIKNHAQDASSCLATHLCLVIGNVKFPKPTIEI